MSHPLLELTADVAGGVFTDRHGRPFVVDRIAWSICRGGGGYWSLAADCRGGERQDRRQRMVATSVAAGEPLTWPTEVEAPPVWFVTAAEALRAETASQDGDGERLRRLLSEQIREATARLDGLAGRPRDAAQGFLDGLRLARTLLDTDGSVR